MNSRIYIPTFWCGIVLVAIECSLAAEKAGPHDKPTGERKESSAGHHAGSSELKITGDSKVGFMRGGFEFLVNPGDEGLAKDYYNRIEKLLGVIFLDDTVSPTPLPPHKATTLDELLVYFGYQNAAGNGVKAQDLERIDSFVLMPRDQAEFTALDNATTTNVAALLSLADFWDASNSRPKVLVSRFFAPKISTYYNFRAPYEPINPDDIIPGWRKVVRIPPRAGSGAAAAGLRYAYILFNFKEKEPDLNPFRGNESGNNQVILVPETFDPADPLKDSCYFLVYVSRTNSYKLGFFLAADFDLPGHLSYQAPPGTTPAVDSRYYVPTACAACHGHGDTAGTPPTPNDPFKLAKGNYLDTDQWYDWMDFDFHGVAGSLNDVVFDGGKDQSSDNYKRAFNVISALNLGIKEETQRVEVPPSFGTKAVQKWLDLHKVNATSAVAADPIRKAYSSRALAAPPGGWDPTKPKEMRLLRLLNNHCFRCHSSMIYNVFDKEAVKSRAETIVLFLNQKKFLQGNSLPGFTMPQGRVLPCETRGEMTRLVLELFPPQRVSYVGTTSVPLTIVARNFRFKINGTDNPTLEVPEGATVSITMTSAGGTHDWQLEDSSGTVVTKTATVSGSATVTHSFTAGVPGNYTYFCDIGSHRENGMEGEFTVVPK